MSLDIIKKNRQALIEQNRKLRAQNVETKKPFDRNLTEISINQNEINRLNELIKEQEYRICHQPKV